MGLRRRLGHQPRRLRPNAELRVPTDRAAPPHPDRARARADHDRRSRGVELGRSCGRSWRLSGRSHSAARSARGRGSARSSPRSRSRSSSPSWFGRRPPICRDAFVRTFDVLNIVAVSFVAMLLLVTFARGRDAAQERVEALLLNILPEEIAQRLQADPSTIADHFDDASILFADVVDFTPLSGRLDAREVVGLLDRLFTSFDELVDRYEVEKIKTIGDCYMVAAGVPRHRADHAQALARARARDARMRARTCLTERTSSRHQAAHRDQLRPGRRRRDRAQALSLRPVGRHGQHGEPDGVARRARHDPDHTLDLGAPRGRLRDGAARPRRGEGEGRGRDVPARRSREHPTV